LSGAGETPDNIGKESVNKGDSRLKFHQERGNYIMPMSP